MGGIVYVFHPYTGCKVIENKETDTVQQGFTLSFFYLVMKYQIGKKYAIKSEYWTRSPGTYDFRMYGQAGKSRKQILSEDKHL